MSPLDGPAPVQDTVDRPASAGRPLADALTDATGQIVMAIFPRACPPSRRRIAAGASASG
jgi:hypothetical protein